MPFSRPTLSDLRAATAADINAAVPGGDALLRHSNLNIVGQVVAGFAHAHYGYLDWIALQAVPFTATLEYLEGWAALKGVARKPASAATGAVAFTGVAGTVIPEGTRLVRGDGVSYLTTALVTLDVNGEGTGAAACETSGLTGEAAVGVVLVLSTPIPGVVSTALVSTALDGAVDVEADAALRGRMLQAYAAPARGGSAEDYVRWALEVPGVTRAWVQRNGMGAGTVIVRFMMDLARVDFDGFPQGDDGVATDEFRVVMPAAGDQLLVADHIFALQPVTALVYAAAPLANTIAFTIAGLTTAPAAVKTAIETAIAQVLLDQGEPGGSVALSYVEAAVAAIPGAVGYVITAITATNGTITPSTNGNIGSDTGYLPVLGTVTFS